MNYDIENVGIDHPALLSGNFEACTIARCRQAGPPPWALDLDCRGLPRYGTTKETCTLTWHGTSEKYADRAEKTYQAPRLTEDGAIGLGASVFAALKEGQITEVALRGTGVDYWIDDRRAVLEVSGIENGSSGDLAKRHRAKRNQVGQGSLHKAGFPGYVFVVDFGGKRAIFGYHP